MTFKPDPKPAKRKRKQIRKVDPNALKRKMVRDGMCRADGCMKVATDPHHIIRKGSPHFGDDVEANILPLCRGCHMDYHDGRKPGFRFESEEYDYVTEKLGETFGYQFLLDRYGKVLS